MKINGINFKKAILDAINGMALGLFATLIVAVILGQIAKWVNFDFTLFEKTINIGVALNGVSVVAKGLMGVGIGLGMAFALKFTGLKLVSGAVAGAISTSTMIVAGSDPVTCFFVVIIVLILLDVVFKKKTPVDIIIIPLFTLILSFVLAILIYPPMSFIIQKIGEFIIVATAYQPFISGFVIASLSGILLTAPISSAAIMIAIGINGVAGGAAAIGGATQMIGFAVQGFVVNGIGQSLATAFGTSMIQFKNIVKKPIIWLPTTLVSAFLGAFSAQFGLIETAKEGAGMGTSGLVGPLVSLDTMGFSFWSVFWIVLFMFVLPLVLVTLVHLFFIKMKWYRREDFKLEIE